MVTKRKTPRPRRPLPATISAAEFKATCLELMDTVAKTGASIVVTKRGHPVARLSPVRAPAKSLYGFMKGRMWAIGDIMSPIDVEWFSERRLARWAKTTKADE